MYEDKELAARLSLGLTEIFLVVAGFIGFTEAIPINMGWYLYALAVLLLIASTILDIICGGRAMLWTLSRLLGGALILWVFYSIKVTLMPWVL